MDAPVKFRSTPKLAIAERQDQDISGAEICRAVEH
jgi:hypothetical protein